MEKKPSVVQVGRSHLAVVVKPNPELLATYTATHSAEAVEQLVPIGIVTLEDIIEEVRVLFCNLIRLILCGVR